WFQIAELNVGLLFVVGISALGIFGIVLGGWSSNSHYSLLGALRSAAQLVSYETAAGMAIVGGLLLAGTLSTREIIQAQDDYGTWFAFAAPVGFFVYIVASIAETNRAPFDLPEAESELVAGYMTEYSGFRWALYFLAEYANMVVVAAIATKLFLGAWLRPLPGWHQHLPGPPVELLDALPSLLFLGIALYSLRLAPKQPVRIQKLFMVLVAGLCALLAAVTAAALFAPDPVKYGIHGAFWFLAKVGAYVYAFLWVRFTFPRYRFDQLMRLGWRFLIPLALVNVIVVGSAIVVQQNWGWRHPVVSAIVTTLIMLGVALFLAYDDAEHEAAVQAAGGE